jgi:hypothetical protein
MAAVHALVVKIIEPLVAAPFDCDRVTEGLVLLVDNLEEFAGKLEEFHGGSTAVREYIEETRRSVSECLDLTTIDHG